MAEFLAENNLCGRTLLRIVSVGNAIIAELLRLKDYIPDIFRLESKADQQKYGDIILDFSYFRISQAQDKKIEDNEELQRLDEEFRDNHLEILTRFYLAFESTHQYATDLQLFIEELDKGHYIQQTLESILQDAEGKQLMCESLYLFGVILLILDMHIPGIIRERLLVSYYRYSANNPHGDSNIDDVCKLLRSTGFTNNSGKRAPNYPENYFSRFPFDETFVNMVIGRLRSDDVYNQMSVYPLPDHRSTALSNQAGMLYVCLYFAPKILHNQPSQMREIVDKFFCDNWVIHIYMGVTVNLVDAWDPYKAAKNALTSVIEPNLVKNLCTKHMEALTKVKPKTVEILKDGVLAEDFLIQNINKIINLVRECNVILRWYVLHTSPTVLEFGGMKRSKQLQDIITSHPGFKFSSIFQLMLNTSQLELNITNMLKEFISEKENRWNTFKKDSVDMITELSDFFSGSRPVMKLEKNEALKKWFLDIAKEIENLNCDNINICGRKIVLLIQALDEGQEFHNLESNMQVKQYLMDTRKCLHNMIRTINIKEEILINIQLIGDLSYAWRIIDTTYTKMMQEKIKDQPTIVIKLRAIFLKLASALEIPLLRINQAHSEDLISVSKYYSHELVNYFRNVVQIIPETMFGILAKIIHLQTEEIKDIPTRLEKDKLKEYAQFSERFQVAELTYSLSVFTKGILMMQKTLVGVIELDPKLLLEDGIRKELVTNLSKSLHLGLTFNARNKPTELESKLSNLTKTIGGYRKSFEYVQDFLNLQTLKLWQEEFTRIINYNVEKECNTYSRNKIQDWQSIYQSTTVPIPTYPSVASDGTVNFMGRLAKEILACTDPRTTIYFDLKSTWYDRRSQKEVANSRLFTHIREAICPVGLVGLDRLFTFMFVGEMETNIQKILKNISSDKMWIDTFEELTKELEKDDMVPNPNKFYPNFTGRWIKVWPKLLDLILGIGHKQIIRQHIAYELNNSCRLNAKNLESSLKNLNDALLLDIKRNEIDPEKPKPDNKMLFELNKYLAFAGLYDPLEQIFVETTNSHSVALLLFLFTISHIPKLQYNENINSLISRKSGDQIDGAPLIVGILTLLRQFHRETLNLFIDYMCQYVTSLVYANLGLREDFTIELQTIYFLEIFVRTAKLSRTILEDKIPESIINQYEFILSNKT